MPRIWEHMAAPWRRALMNKTERLAEAMDQYCAAVAGGDPALARLVVDRALSRGVSRAEIYLDVLAPSQVRIGELWHEGRLNVAQEHLATTVTMEMMDLLRRETRPGAPLGVRAVVTPVEGDQHSMGARMIADFLVMDGWEVDFLSCGTPAGDLAEFVRQRKADLLALSATMPELLPNAVAAADAVRGLGSSGPKVILGGSALGRTSLDLDSLRCDAVAGNVLEAVAEARRLVGLAERKLTLPAQLSLMGRRINAIRTSRSMTQQDLADASGLDRTYISLVEHGRQNLTIAAVLKIAHALERAHRRPPDPGDDRRLGKRLR